MNSSAWHHRLPNAMAIRGGVHTRSPHDSGRKHVTGAAAYTDDIRTPEGTLHIYIAMSTRAHAIVDSLDLTAVRSAPGVALVLTAKDVPGQNDISPVAGDDPLFADGLVQYVGQSLFAVAATSIDAARAAAKLAVVAYEDLPAVITIDQAMDAKLFFHEPRVIQRGDAAREISVARHRLQGRFYVGGQEHFYLEGQAALAIPGEDQDVTVYSSTQHPTEIQHKVAHVLGIPNHAVTVEVRRMGGGFGGKESQGTLPAAVAALVALRTRRAAKVVYDRDDDFIITGKRHDFRIDYRVGFDDQGRIAGIEFEHAVRCGMSLDLSEPVADRAMLHADNCYYLPAVKITSYRCKTHTQSNTAFRGFGGPQGMIGMERVIDHIASHLDTDPLDVRRANFYAPAASNVSANMTPYQMQVTDCVIDEIVSELADTAEYNRRRTEIRAWNSGSSVLKRGIALTPVKFGISFTKTFLNQAGALVHVYSDGSVHLNHGGTEMGQGLFVKVAQVVAHEFQIDIGRIKITATNTGKVPNTSATAASSGSDLNGMAAKAAAAKIKARLIAHLAEHFQTKSEDIAFLHGRVRVGAVEMTFEEVVQQAYLARVPLSATGFYATPKISWSREEGKGRPFYYFAYGAAVTEVAIDTLTGENRLLRVDILHDCGRSLNPAIDLGQIEGGYVQGAGWLTTEELVWDAQGRLQTHAPSTYKIPACSDRAADMRIAIWSKGENKEETVYRSKAVGEPPLMLGISAFSAICDAVASVGQHTAYPDLHAPATPERILTEIIRIRSSLEAVV